MREEAAALSPAERRSLRSLGVRLGAFSVFLPDLPSPEALDLVRAVLAPGRPPPRPGRLARGQDAAPKPVLAAAGLRRAGDLLVEASRLEALDAALRAAPSTPRGVEVAPALAQVLEGPVEQLFAVLRALGFAPLEKLRTDAPVLWRRRKAPAPRPQAPISDASPFSALAALRPPGAGRALAGGFWPPAGQGSARHCGRGDGPCENAQGARSRKRFRPFGDF